MPVAVHNAILTLHFCRKLMLMVAVVKKGASTVPGQMGLYGNS